VGVFEAPTSPPKLDQAWLCNIQRRSTDRRFALSEVKDPIILLLSNPGTRRYHGPGPPSEGNQRLGLVDILDNSAHGILSKKHNNDGFTFLQCYLPRRNRSEVLKPEIKPRRCAIQNTLSSVLVTLALRNPPALDCAKSPKRRVLTYVIAGPRALWPLTLNGCELGNTPPDHVCHPRRDVRAEGTLTTVRHFLKRRCLRRRHGFT
jgi:hypothetical protein